LVNDRQAALIRNAISSIDLDAFDILCDAALTDPFCNRITVVRLQIAIGKPRPHRRAIRISADDLNLGILFFEISAHTGKRAAGADGCDKRGNLPFGLFPDFRAGAAIMRVAISRVIELVRPEPASLLCEATRDTIVIFRILVWLFRHRLYLSAERTEQMHFLRRLIIRNYNNSAIPSGAPDHGKTDPSVTGGSFDDRCAWLKPTRCLRVSDDSVGGSIFHRSGRIHEFRLPQNLTTRQFGQASQSNQRRVPNVSINPESVRGQCPACRSHILRIPSQKLLSYFFLFDSQSGQIPKADKTAEYLVTNAVSSGCDVSKLSTDRFSSCKSLLACSGFFSGRIVSCADASTRRAMLWASS